MAPVQKLARGIFLQQKLSLIIIHIIVNNSHDRQMC